MEGPVAIITEIGSNHEGSLSRAQELIRRAARSGADGTTIERYDAPATLRGVTMASLLEANAE